MATTNDAQAIPYCGPNDAPDVPYWQQRQAERIAALLTAHDTDFSKIPGMVVSGSDSITIASTASSATKTIQLPPGFTAPPFVVLQNTANPAGRAAMLNLYVNATTKDKFDVKIQTADNNAVTVGYSIVFNWMASL
jgi:hypothetical protein